MADDEFGNRKTVELEGSPPPPTNGARPPATTPRRLATPTPDPRLPIEPGDRPLYRVEPRVGCSSVSIVSLLTLVAFVFFFFRVAPGMVQSVQEFSLPRVLGLEVVTTPTSTPDPEEEEEPELPIVTTPLPPPRLTPTFQATVEPTPILPSPTAFPTTGPAVLDPTSTVTPPPPPTDTPLPPVAEYVKVGNTEGTGVYLRAEPKRDARRLLGLPDNTILLIVGPNVFSEEMEWRHVQTTRGETLSGYILTIYLGPSGPP